MTEGSIQRLIEKLQGLTSAAGVSAGASACPLAVAGGVRWLGLRSSPCPADGTVLSPECSLSSSSSFIDVGSGYGKVPDCSSPHLGLPPTQPARLSAALLPTAGCALGAGLVTKTAEPTSATDCPAHDAGCAARCTSCGRAALRGHRDGCGTSQAGGGRAPGPDRGPLQRVPAALPCMRGSASTARLVTTSKRCLSTACGCAGWTWAQWARSYRRCCSRAAMPQPSAT